MRDAGKARLGTAIIASVVAVATAACVPTPPTVAGSVAPTSITIANGTVTATATVTGGSSCVFSSSPAVIGFPVTVACSNGIVKHVSVLPANHRTTAVSYTFSVTVSGPGGSASATLGSVSVAAGAGGADVATDIQSGAMSICVLVAAGGVSCWGHDGVAANSNTPTRVVGVGGTGQLGGVKNVVTNLAGSYCALLTSGRVDCWGSNYDYQLGNGTTAANSASPTAVMVNATTPLSGVRSVVSNGSYTYCAVLTTGGVDCWGWYWGTGSGTFAAPVLASGDTTHNLATVQSVAGVGNSYCALHTTGAVDCWGSDVHGQLGNGTPYAQSPTPVHVADLANDGNPLSGVASIAIGGTAYCAVVGAGGVDCWGYGGSYQLGNNSVADSPSPVAVRRTTAGNPTLTGATAAGSEFTGSCAVTTGNALDCWGNNSDGQMGDGTISTTPYARPVAGVAVTSIVGARDASAGNYCALLTSAGVDCWGNNTSDQLGDGNTAVRSTVPVSVHGVGAAATLGGVVALTGSIATFCTVVTTGAVDCWGSGYGGVLGNGSNASSDVPLTAGSIT